MRRRAFLLGAGGVAVGLPFFDEFAGRGSAQAEVPVRAFNCSFGLGLFPDMQQPGLGGVLEPLRAIADKLLVLRGVNYRLGNHNTSVPASGGIPNSHLETTTFTGTKVQDDLNRAGGASLDQALRRHAYPDGLPPGMLSTVQTGLAYEIGHNARDIRSWNPDGSPASRFEHRADRLFESLFGSIMMPDAPTEGPSPEEVRACRRRRSVLDAVVEQYRHHTGDRSRLGAASRVKLSLHLERIREVEQRVYAASCEEAPPPPAASCSVPGAPSDFINSDGLEYQDVTVAQLERTWRLLVDTFALGVQCDQFRFGSMVFMAQGARIRLSGDYSYGGERIYSFNDIRDWDAIDGRGNKTSHEYWHAYGMGGSGGERVREAARAHAHFMVRQCAYFAEALDSADYADGNGKSIFENAMVTFATESGSGNHNRSRADEIELANVFHAISPAGDRFRTGEIDLGTRDALHLYNTMLQAHGVETLLGSGEAGVDEILV
ncbi:MAG: DUF1552 domain-containing protein [Myxococcota bacterium]